MKTPAKLLIVSCVIAAAAGIIAIKPPLAPHSDPAEVTYPKLPRLLDLGADKCVPCKLMAPVLAEMKNQYAAQMTVEFIDIWKNPDAAEKYGVEIIPTQIFFDAEGKELFRHTGFLAKEEILAKWKELGVPLP